MKNKPIKILCVDDNELVLEGIRLKLKLASANESGDSEEIDRNFEWVGALHSADELVTEILKSQPHVVLLDIDMPGRDPFSALEQVRELFPNVHVLIVSGYVKPDLIDRAMESGAWGYVSKHTGADTIVKAIEDVAHGRIALGPDVLQAYRRRI